MRVVQAAICLVLLLLFSDSSCTDVDKEKLVKIGNWKFGKDFFKLLSEHSEENILFSPLSAHIVLSMLYAGAGGETKESIGKLLYSEDPNISAEGYHAILNEISSANSNFELSLANKVYVKSDHELKDEFKNICKTQYLSEVESVNFAESTKAAEKINTWVSQKTKDKIKDILKPDDLNVDTHVVLANALYLKGEWFKPFNVFSTHETDFHVTDDKVEKVQMMRNGGNFYYKKDTDLGCEMVHLPFKDRSYSMLIVVPLEKNGIKEVEAKLQAAEPTSALSNFSFSHIEISLPKFKVSQTIDLGEYLKELNLGGLFDSSRCDLSNMLAYSEDVWISKAVQKTYIDVNEYGCEAASASGIVAVGRSLPRAHVEADHPFLFSIIHKDAHNDTNVLLFGRISNPNEK